MSRRSLGTIILTIREQLLEMTELYGEAEQLAYEGGQQAEAKVRVMGASDPTGERATDEAEEILQIREQLRRAEHAAGVMVAAASGAIAGLRRVVRNSGVQLPTRGVYRWTEEEARAAERRAKARRGA